MIQFFEMLKIILLKKGCDYQKNIIKLKRYTI